MARGTGAEGCERQAQTRGAGADAPTPELLRHVVLDNGYHLATWDLHRRGGEYNKEMLGYRFWYAAGPASGNYERTIFEGDDFGCSPVQAIDSDEVLRGILGFLTLRPGDTDEEWFERYTSEQMAFAESADAEMLQLYTSDEDAEPFEDVDADPTPPRALLRPFSVELEDDAGARSTWTTGALTAEAAGELTLRVAATDGYDIAGHGWHVAEVRELPRSVPSPVV